MMEDAIQGINKENCCIYDCDKNLMFMYCNISTLIINNNNEIKNLPFFHCYINHLIVYTPICLMHFLDSSSINYLSIYNKVNKLNGSIKITNIDGIKNINIMELKV